MNFNGSIDFFKVKWTLSVMVEEPPTSFSPFSLADCTLLSHFSFNDFIAIAFLDLAGDLVVLLSRKVLIGLVYKPASVLSLSLASSVLYLLSNLVSLP